MKRNILAVVIPALLAASAANAAEIYNKDGNKLDLYGKVDARYQSSKDNSQDGDQTYLRLGFKGDTQITDSLSGYGQWEYDYQGNHAEAQGTEGSLTRLAFAGLKFADFGSFDYGRNYGVLYDIEAWTDLLPVFGGDGYTNSDNFMTGRSNNLATYRNNNFFGMVDGLNFALQYQGKNEYDRTDSAKTQNGDGFGMSSTYTIEGFNFGAAYSTSDRTNNTSAKSQEYNTTAFGDKAQAWTLGTKYDANNVYLAVMYAETLNMTPVGSGPFAAPFIANKTQNVEVVAQYQFDFGLRPSLAYVQSRGKGLDDDLRSGLIENDHDLVKYFSVGTYYYFNKNMSTYIDYKINRLKSDDFTRATGISTDNIVGVGLTYQF